ncbi:MAG TPA: hypothetical protein VGJ09_01145 [Bryobacteraceae bacterium]|jgi:hypothetical protein
MHLRKTLLHLTLFMAGLMLLQPGLFAQGRGGRGGGAAPAQTPKAAAPFDLTGYWVSIITEDWRYRMVVPAPGDYQGVPMTPEARKIAESWDIAKETASGDPCKSYGAPALLRAPGRLHITWQDDQTLKMDADAGTQTRMFHFAGWKPAGGPPSWQGDSIAEWERGGGRGATDGSLKVTTTNLKSGFLRKNGVPYSENANLMEYFDLIKEPNGDPLMVVTIITTDPMYLRQPFVITSQFKKQASDSGWKPSACSAKW